MNPLSFDDYTVRPLEQQDSPGFFQLVEQNRQRLENFFARTVSGTQTPEDTERFVAAAIQRRTDNTYLPFIVLHAEAIIGFIDVKNIDRSIPKAELGCFIAETHEGKGVSFKAMSAVIDHLFTDHGFNKLFLRTHPTNTSARALAEKCGFEVEGILRRDYKTFHGELKDLVYYGLLK